LQRGGILLPWLVVWRFAPLAAVAHPSAHVALVTRLPSWEQSAAGPRHPRGRYQRYGDLGHCLAPLRMLGFGFSSLLLVARAQFRIIGFNLTRTFSEAKWQSK
jgi:hypothetical protein